MFRNNNKRDYIYQNNEHNIENQQVQSIVNQSFRRHFNKRKERMRKF